MPDTLMIDISKWVDKAKGRTRAFASEFIQDLNEVVVRETPGPGNSIAKHPRPGQPTGFLRGSWYATIDNSDSLNHSTTADPGGDTTVSKMNLVAAKVELGNVFRARNGASYAYFVEFGTSKMAPRAFVRGAMLRVPEIAEAAARRIADR